MPAKTVLLVDDEPHIRYMLQLKFGAAGYTVLTASEGRQAFDIAKTHVPTIVISDYQMPGWDGLRLCKELADEPATSRVPVILLTARGHRVAPQELAATSIRHVLDKPFSVLELLRRAEDLVGQPAEDASPSAGTGANVA